MVHDFQTARLFLSHYGFLSLEALKVNLTVCEKKKFFQRLKGYLMKTIQSFVQLYIHLNTVEAAQVSKNYKKLLAL